MSSTFCRMNIRIKNLLHLVFVLEQTMPIEQWQVMTELLER